MAQRGNRHKMQVCYQAGIIRIEYHQNLFNHPLKRDSQASIETLVIRGATLP
jgi:hypothetical protein